MDSFKLFSSPKLYSETERKLACLTFFVFPVFYRTLQAASQKEGRTTKA